MAGYVRLKSVHVSADMYMSVCVCVCVYLSPPTHYPVTHHVPARPNMSPSLLSSSPPFLPFLPSPPPRLHAP